MTTICWEKSHSCFLLEAEKSRGGREEHLCVTSCNAHFFLYNRFVAASRPFEAQRQTNVFVQFQFSYSSETISYGWRDSHLKALTPKTKVLKECWYLFQDYLSKILKYQNLHVWWLLLILLFLSFLIYGTIEYLSVSSGPIEL